MRMPTATRWPSLSFRSGGKSFNPPTLPSSTTKKKICRIPSTHYFVFKTLLSQYNQLHFQCTCDGTLTEMPSTHSNNTIHSPHIRTRTPGVASNPTTQFLKSLTSISPTLLGKAPTRLPQSDEHKQILPYNTHPNLVRESCRSSRNPPTSWPSTAVIPHYCTTFLSLPADRLGKNVLLSVQYV